MHTSFDLSFSNTSAFPLPTTRFSSIWWFRCSFGRDQPLSFWSRGRRARLLLDEAELHATVTSELLRFFVLDPTAWGLSGHPRGRKAFGGGHPFRQPRSRDRRQPAAYAADP
jgi:hypothetical protein